ncbi:MAG: tRNA-(ms[2]io[6]A)-hydroxylase [Polyangiaceae bacterium]|nr:tRNA-(ms[2]io[6]A)-hydroxylase [Polyangiaceae bacterium]
MLGLQVETNPKWVAAASSHVARVLVDHAHCEMKAATNALSLSARCMLHPKVARALVDLAEEELRHFRRVLDELDRRGIALEPPEEDWYAAELRRRVAGERRGKQTLDLDAVLVDRLLVGALIEARSCERFRLLADALGEVEPELAAFYRELFADEARHHRTFFDLAVDVAGDASMARDRLARIASIEADVVRALDARPTMHG